MKHGDYVCRPSIVPHHVESRNLPKTDATDTMILVECHRQQTHYELSSLKLTSRIFQSSIRSCILANAFCIIRVLDVAHKQADRSIRQRPFDGGQIELSTAFTGPLVCLI